MKPHIKLVKIIINTQTGIIVMKENVNDNRRLYKLFIELAKRYEPIYPD